MGHPLLRCGPLYSHKDALGVVPESERDHLGLSESARSRRKTITAYARDSRAAAGSRGPSSRRTRRTSRTSRASRAVYSAFSFCLIKVLSPRPGARALTRSYVRTFPRSYVRRTFVMPSSCRRSSCRRSSFVACRVLSSRVARWNIVATGERRGLTTFAPVKFTGSRVLARAQGSRSLSAERRRARARTPRAPHARRRV